MGVWIEMSAVSWFTTGFTVTPFVGVWIEMAKYSGDSVDDLVTPFVGVWIEIQEKLLREYAAKSLPSWECGLKSLPSKE